MAKFRTMCLDADNVKGTVANEMEGPMFKTPRPAGNPASAAFCVRRASTRRRNCSTCSLGQMSLVGPRPLDVSEVARFEPWQRRRLAVQARPDLPLADQRPQRTSAFEEWRGWISGTCGTRASWSTSSFSGGRR